MYKWIMIEVRSRFYVKEWKVDGDDVVMIILRLILISIFKK